MTSEEGSLRRHLAAVWFADIVGYTELAARDELTALRHVDLLQLEALRAATECGGRIVKRLGDAVLAEFPSTEAAVRAALTLRDQYRKDADPTLAQLRIGVHVGDVLAATDGDVFGEGVNIASRLQHECLPGEVVITGDIRRQLRQRVEYRFTSRGWRRLRGVPEAVEVFVVDRSDPIQAGAPAIVPLGSTSRTASLKSHFFRTQIGIVLSSLLVLTLVAAWLAWRTRGAPEITTSGESIAVLPFSVRGSAEVAYLGEGMVSLLSGRLDDAGDLPTVDPRVLLAEVQQLSDDRDNQLDIDDRRVVAQRLGARWYIAGEIFEVHDRIRLDATVYDESTGGPVGRASVEGALTDVFWLADHMASQILQRLGSGFAFTPYTVKPKCRVSCTPEDVFRHLPTRLKERGAICEAVLGIRVDTLGYVSATDILKPSGDLECDHVLQEWARTTTWIPAYNGDRPVVTWMAQPVSITQ